MTGVVETQHPGMRHATSRFMNKSADSDAGRNKNARAEAKNTLFLPLNTALCLCLFSHIIAACVAPIQDCDETFNYWEPLHYLNHGYGLQTWEWSPEFALRSYAFEVVHAIPAKLGYLFTGSKRFEFYFLRVLLAFCCAATETRLYAVICRTLNPRVGIIYLIIVAFSPGMFYASTAFLPSSFAMLTATLGLAAFMDWTKGPKTESGIMWFGIGAIVGWPFSGALVIPFAAEEVTVAILSGSYFDLFRRVLDGIVRCLVVLVILRPRSRTSANAYPVPAMCDRCILLPQGRGCTMAPCILQHLQRTRSRT